MKIKAAIVDFATSIQNNRWIKFIQSFCEIEEDYINPDFVIYSCFGASHLKYDSAIKIFLCDENVYPDFNQCDYAVSSLKLEYGNRHLWFPPSYSTYLNRNSKQLPPLPQNAAQRKFCSFIYSQDSIGKGSILRKQFCELLMQYRKVDCPGKILHNIDAPELAARTDSANWNESKLKFLRAYKFNIAFENSSTPGYITEKLMDCYLADTVPIYFGSAGDLAPFPKESMIYANDFPDLESLVAKVREIDQDDDKYFTMLAANPLRNGLILHPGETLQKFLTTIFESKGLPTPDKDPLMVSDATRFLRTAKYGTSSLEIHLRMLLIAIKACYSRYILRDSNARKKLGVEFYQLLYTKNNVKTIRSKNMESL